MHDKVSKLPRVDILMTNGLRSQKLVHMYPEQSRGLEMGMHQQGDVTSLIIFIVCFQDCVDESPSKEVERCKDHLDRYVNVWSIEDRECAFPKSGCSVTLGISI